MFIYKITNTINNKVYIGQTIRDLSVRWGDYKHLSKKKSNRAINHAMRKHGIENFKIEEIDGANNQTELNYKEWLWIHKFNSLSPNGYNIRQGGGSKGSFPEHYRNKISILTSKSLSNPDIRDKISKAQKLRFSKKEELDKSIKNSLEIWQREGYREKISSMWKLFYCNNPDVRIKQNKSHLKTLSKPFLVWRAVGNRLNYQKGEFIGIWNNEITCVRDLNIKTDKNGHAKGINENLIGKKKSAKGYIFEYLNNTREE